MDTKYNTYLLASSCRLLVDGAYKAANQLPLPMKLYTLMFSSFPHPQPLLKNREPK